MTATYNLVCPQSTTFTFAFKPETNGVRWDLTNYSATLTVRPFTGSSTTTLLATTENNKISINTSTSVVTVTFTATETNLSPEPYVYDFVFNSGSIITRILEGKFLVTAGVTV